MEIGGQFQRCIGAAVPLLTFKQQYALWLADPVLQNDFLQGRTVDNQLRNLGFPIACEWVKRGEGASVLVGNLTGHAAKQIGIRELVCEDNYLLPIDPSPELMKIWQAEKPKTSIPHSSEPLRKAACADDTAA